MTNHDIVVVCWQMPTSWFENGHNGDNASTSLRMLYITQLTMKAKSSAILSLAYIKCSTTISSWFILSLVTCIQRLSKLPKEGTQGWHLCHQNNLLNMDIIIVGKLKCHNHSSWWHKHKCTTPFQYSLYCPHLNVTRVEKKRVVQTWIMEKHGSDSQNPLVGKWKTTKHIFYTRWRTHL